MSTKANSSQQADNPRDTLCGKLESLAERLLFADTLTDDIRNDARGLCRALAHELNTTQTTGAALARSLDTRLDTGTDGITPTLHDLSTAARYFQDIVCRRLDSSVPDALQRFMSDSSMASRSAHNRQIEVDDEAWALFLLHEKETCPHLTTELDQYRQTSSPTHLTYLRQVFHRIRGEAGFCGVSEIAQLAEKVEHHIDANPSPNLDFLVAACTWLQAAFAALRTHDPLPVPVPHPVMPSGEESPAGSSSGAPRSHRIVTNIRDTGESSETLTETAAPTITVSDPELARDFVTEAREHFERVDQALILLETTPNSTDAMGYVFRGFHTIKGIAGFLAMEPVRDLCHEVETLLDLVRKGTLTFEGRLVEAVFQSLDLLKVMVEAVDAHLSSGGIIPVPNQLPTLLVHLKGLASTEHPMMVANDGEATSTTPPPATDEPLLDDATKPATGSANAASTQNVMRVAAAKLDMLLDTIGELVIAETVVSEDETLQAIASARLGKNLSQLRKITRSLQTMGMSLRMIPVDGLFRKMARLVRDLSKQSGKPVSLNLEGTDIELDKTIVERLSDPLMHMIRNAVDHGIEDTPTDRILAGKPSEATITLRAQQQGANIHISVSDDGRGMQRDRILKKGMEMGLILDEATATDADVFSLIFVPGFSTARAITDISGRGVGMDVVKRDITAVRGSVTVESVPGRGATFTVILPLTLAIIDGMSVRVGTETYIIPMLSIIECFRPEPQRLHTAVGRAEMLEFRGRHIPLARSGTLLRVPAAVADPTKGIVVILEDGDRLLALLVDALVGQQQTVIKPLDPSMGTLPGLSGSTILGNGNPALVLDVGGIMGIATGRMGPRYVATRVDEGAAS